MVTRMSPVVRCTGAASRARLSGAAYQIIGGLLLSLDATIPHFLLELLTGLSCVPLNSAATASRVIAIGARRAVGGAHWRE